MISLLTDLALLHSAPEPSSGFTEDSAFEGLLDAELPPNPSPAARPPTPRLPTMEPPPQGLRTAPPGPDADTDPIAGEHPLSGGPTVVIAGPAEVSAPPVVPTPSGADTAGGEDTTLASAVPAFRIGATPRSRPALRVVDAQGADVIPLSSRAPSRARMARAFAANVSADSLNSPIRHEEQDVSRVHAAPVPVPRRAEPRTPDAVGGETPPAPGEPPVLQMGPFEGDRVGSEIRQPSRGEGPQPSHRAAATTPSVRASKAPSLAQAQPSVGTGQVLEDRAAPERPSIPSGRRPSSDRRLMAERRISDRPMVSDRAMVSDRPISERPMAPERPVASGRPISDPPISDRAMVSDRPVVSDRAVSDRAVSERPGVSDRPAVSQLPVASERRTLSERPILSEPSISARSISERPISERPISESPISERSISERRTVPDRPIASTHPSASERPAVTEFVSEFAPERPVISERPVASERPVTARAAVQHAQTTPVADRPAPAHLRPSPPASLESIVDRGVAARSHGVEGSTPGAAPGIDVGTRAAVVEQGLDRFAGLTLETQLQAAVQRDATESPEPGARTPRALPTTAGDRPDIQPKAAPRATTPNPALASGPPTFSSRPIGFDPAGEGTEAPMGSAVLASAPPTAKPIETRRRFDERTGLYADVADAGEAYDPIAIEPVEETLRPERPEPQLQTRRVRVELDADTAVEVSVRAEGIEVAVDGTKEALEQLDNLEPELRTALQDDSSELLDYHARERDADERSEGESRDETPRASTVETSEDAPATRGRGSLVNLIA